jgi:hypothetical protein
MYDHLGALKDDALDLAAGAVGVTVGAVTARWVTKQVGGLLPEFAGKEIVNGLIPVAVGTLIQTYGASKLRKDTFARNAVTGVSVGMVAYGLGKVVLSLMPASSPFVLNGLGETDVYDYGMSGFGIGPGDVTAYMHGAPFTSESLMGAPVDVQLAGAPVSISSEPSMAAMAAF